MRILMIVDLPWDERLGAARVFMELSKAWEADGHNVSRYCLSDAFPAKSSSPPLLAFRRLRLPRKAAAFVKNNAAQFDVIDCIVGALPFSKRRLNFNGLLVARSIGSHRLYRDFEKMARKLWPDQPRGKLLGRIFYTVFQQQLFRNSEKALRSCDLVNVPNEMEINDLPSNTSAIVEPYGLTGQLRRKLAVCSSDARLQRPTVSFIGMWSNRKGARDWAEIIRRVRGFVPKARFKLLGTMVATKEVLGALNVTADDAIEIVAEYSPDELPNLLADATIGAFPSYAEGFGLGLLEQLAAGIPTVAYDAPGPRSILRDALPELLVPLGQVERFAAALIELFSADANRYWQLVQRCQEVANRFVWSTIAKETARLYQTHLTRVRDGISEF